MRWFILTGLQADVKFLRDALKVVFDARHAFSNVQPLTNIVEAGADHAGKLFDAVADLPMYIYFFITHNANIPVLAEAELVLVMTSDGRVGAIEKGGSVDECREQIIDLLEGGREAFELRSKRYGAG